MAIEIVKTGLRLVGPAPYPVGKNPYIPTFFYVTLQDATYVIIGPERFIDRDSSGVLDNYATPGTPIELFGIDIKNQYKLLASNVAADNTGDTIMDKVVLEVNNYVKTQILADNPDKSGSITVIADIASTNFIQITSVAHGLKKHDPIDITGTTSYNNMYNVEEVIDDDNFKIIETFVADETGDWDTTSLTVNIIDVNTTP